MREALRSRPIRTLAAAQFLLEVQFWFPVWLIFLLDMGFSLTTAVLADAVFRIVSVLSEFPVGILADLVGRRRAYLALAGGSVLTFALITQVENVPILFVAWIVWGVLWALSSGAASAYLYELCLQDELDIDPARAFGLVRAVGNAAMLLSLLSAGYLYDVSPQLPFAVTASLAGVAVVLAYTLPEIRGSRVVVTIQSVIAAIRAALADHRVRRAVTLGVLLLLFGWSARILFQPLALDLSLSTQVIGWMYAAFAAASIVGGLVAGYVGAAHRRPVLAGAFLLVLAALAATGAVGRLGPFVLLPLMGFAYMLAFTVLEVHTNEVVAPAVRATIFGAVSCIAGVGIAVARPSLGVIAERYSVPIAFGVWAAVGVVLVGLAIRGILRLHRAG